MQNHRMFLVLAIIFLLISFGFAQEEVDSSQEISFDSNDSQISVANFDSSQSEVENGFSEETFNTSTSDTLPLETEILPEGSIESETQQTIMVDEEGTTEPFEDNEITEGEEETIQPDSESVTSIDEPEECIFETEFGKVKGVKFRTIFKNESFCAYRGIKYGAAPIGELRLKPSKLASDWYKIDEAFEYGPPCPQKNLPFEMTEDCLSINIFSPNSAKCDTLKPVIAFIVADSRGFEEGPRTLIEECAVVVTFNYRIGLLGFLSLGLPEYSGNMALKDQQLALKWINKNIHIFGGDSDRVTLIGDEGAFVNYHILNDDSRQYFQTAIPMSGSVLNYFAKMTSNNHLEEALDFARDVGARIRNERDLVNLLKTASVDDIIEYTSELYPIGRTLKPSWGPVIEVKSAKQAFITKDPIEIYKNRMEYINIPTIFTRTSLEFETFARADIENTNRIEDLYDRFKFPLPFLDIDYVFCEKELQKIYDKIQMFYFGDGRITIERYLEIFSDLNFNYFIEKAARIQNDYSYESVWMLVNNAQTTLRRFANDTKLLSLNGLGHSEDLCLIFYCGLPSSTYEYIHETNSTNLGSIQAYKAIQFMSELIGNFASTGVPKSPSRGLDEFPTVYGENDSLRYVQLSTSGVSIGANLNKDTYTFWESIEHDIKVIKKTGCDDAIEDSCSAFT